MIKLVKETLVSSNIIKENVIDNAAEINTIFNNLEVFPYKVATFIVDFGDYKIASKKLDKLYRALDKSGANWYSTRHKNTEWRIENIHRRHIDVIKRHIPIKNIKKIHEGNPFS